MVLKLVVAAISIGGTTSASGGDAVSIGASSQATGGDVVSIGYHLKPLVV